MGTINKQSSADVLNVLVFNRIAQGITWGTNNYPAGSNPGWFAFPNSGPPERVIASNLTTNWEAVSAQNAMNSVSYLIGFWGGIVKTRIVIYKSANGHAGSNSWYAHTLTVSDQTAVACLDVGTVPGLYGAYPVTTQLAPPPSRGTPARLSDYQSFATRMTDRFLNLTRNGNAWQLNNTICHSSCHSNCHGSRNRR
jgi:hypothetical protein